MRAPLTERNVRTGKFQRVSPSYLGSQATRRQASAQKRYADARRNAARKAGYSGPLTRDELGR